jgi:hypothetical protein
VAGRRRALIVAIDDYEHPGLRRLRSPTADAQQLGDVLSDPRIGDFEVEVVRNQPAYAVQERIEDLFADARGDDVLLLHFSGHGLKGEAGDLYFAARNTRPDRLASTAVPADFVQRCVRSSASRSIVLFLDCCYGGAFGQGVAVRAAGDVNVLDSFPAGRMGGGRGRAVITASSAMEYAFEGERLTDDSRPQPSLFTAALVQGLGTGEADRDEDGWVSLSELYDYVFDQVRERTPNQTPSRDIEMQGELYLARSGRRRLQPAPLPADLKAAIDEANPYTRLGAVAELRARALSENLPVALGAYRALAEIAASDTRLVAESAAAAIHDVALTVHPEAVDFGAVPVDEASAPRRVAISGPLLATAVRVEVSDPWIRVSEAEGGYDVSVVPRARGALNGEVTFSGPTGDGRVGVRVEGRSPQVPRPASAPDAGSPALPDPQLRSQARESSAAAAAPPASATPVAAPAPAAASAASAGVQEAPEASTPAPATAGAPAKTARQVPFVVGGLICAAAGVLLLLVAPNAWAADSWTRPANLTPALVLLVGGILATASGAAARVGAGLVVGGALAVAWGAVLTVANVAAYGLEYAPEGPVQLVIVALALAGAGIAGVPAVRTAGWHPGLLGPGRLRSVVVGAGLVGGIALLVEAFALSSVMGGSGYEYLRWPSFAAVPLAIAVPWLAARVTPSPLAAGLLAGWAVAVAGVFAVFFGLAAYAGYDYVYGGYDVFLLTLAVLLGAAWFARAAPLPGDGGD